MRFVHLCEHPYIYDLVQLQGDFNRLQLVLFFLCVTLFYEISISEKVLIYVGITPLQSVSYFKTGTETIYANIFLCNFESNNFVNVLWVFFPSIY